LDLGSGISGLAAVGHRSCTFVAVGEVRDMPGIERYDAVVMGAGTAGKLMAWHLGSSGQRVAVIERRYLGGACPNIACMPSKNVIHSAKVASYRRRHAEFGLPRTEGPVDMARVRARKDEMVAKQWANHLLPYTALADLTMTHPTIAEGVADLFSSVPPHAEYDGASASERHGREHA
jgi:choline dehydrogenase-like flavoprotein